MIGNEFTTSFHVHGTLAANATFCWTAARPFTILEVSARGSNASNALIRVGTTASTAAYMADKDVGDSDVPATYGRADFVDTSKFPYIAEDTIMLITVDFDGAAGTAVQNLTIVLTCLSG